MTIDIEQLRKDMEAGTQGDWEINTVTTIWKGGHQSFMDAVSEAAPYIISALNEGVCDIDARRIARLPQIEREYLALREASHAAAHADLNAALNTNIKETTQ